MVQGSQNSYNNYSGENEQRTAQKLGAKGLICNVNNSGQGKQ